MKKLNLIISSLFLLSFASCDLTTDPDITGTNTQALAGEWFLQLRDAADNTLYVDYSHCTTSNTNANDNNMWFLDEDHFWGTQFKMVTNVAAQTFTANSSNILFDGAHTKPAGKPVVALGTAKSVSSAVPSTMKIEDGKILENAAHVPSKTPCDSFYCKMTGVYQVYMYTADSYTITGTDTTVVWKLVNSDGTSDDGPYIITGYRRTGFLEDEH